MSGRARGPCGSTYSGPRQCLGVRQHHLQRHRGERCDARAPGFKFDNTGTTITGASFGRAPDANGWYNHPVAVNFTATDNLSGVAGCQTVTYAGPDGGGAGVPGGCTDNAGNPASGGTTINYDSTGPSVSGSPDRGPDSNGWYSRPVSVGFGGSDNASGVAGCSGGGTYSGPDGTGTLSGSCSDNAGNSGSGSVAIRYDATAPVVKGITPSRAPDSAGWFNKPVDVQFGGEDAGSGVASCTKVAFVGPGRRGRGRQRDLHR